MQVRRKEGRGLWLEVCGCGIFSSKVLMQVELEQSSANLDKARVSQEVAAGTPISARVGTVKSFLGAL